MTKVIALAMFLASSAQAAEGILAAGPNTGIEGGLRVSVHHSDTALSLEANLAKCKDEYETVLKSIKAAGFTILLARECVSYSGPAWGTSGGITFIR